MIPDPSPPFEFGASRLVLDQIADLIQRAAVVGLGPDTRDTLLYMEEQLRTRPRTWGDPSYRLKGLQVTVFRRAYRRLHFTYTVHDRVPIVTLWNVKPILGHPLAGP
jgi:hypothetical protein